MKKLFLLLTLLSLSNKFFSQLEIKEKILGKWMVEGVVCTTEMEALQKQLDAQEKQYNDTYKSSTWVFKNDGTITITMPKSDASPGGTGTGQYEVQGEKIVMEINGQPGEYDIKFEDGQLILINVSPLNTIFYVFIKSKL